MTSNARRNTIIACGSAIAVLHFICFFWLSIGHTLSGDAIFLFSRQLHSVSDFVHGFGSVDDLFEYRPMTMLIFTFILHPLCGADPARYHLVAYILAFADSLLACGVVWFWSQRKVAMLLPAAVFILLSPINFYASFGIEFLALQLSAFFYFSALIVILKKPELQWFATILTLMALLSEEHSLILPVHAVLVLSGLNLSPREIVQRTRWLWITVVLFFAFQVAIRGGAFFPTPQQSDRLYLDIGWHRIRDLINGSELLLYFPRRDFSSAPYMLRRAVRILLALPWLIALFWAIKRRDRLALSGLLWAALSLIPIAVIAEMPGPHHYFLALPGMAIFVASVFRNRSKAVGILFAACALILLRNTSSDAKVSSIVATVDQARDYHETIRSIATSTGRNEFYVTRASAPGFLYEIGSGNSLSEIFGQKMSFHIGSQGDPLPMELLLSNQLNVIAGSSTGIADGLRAGPASLLSDDPACRPVWDLFEGAGECAVFIDGQPLMGSNVASAIFSVPGHLVTTSGTALMVRISGPVHLVRKATLSQESRDGVVVEIYSEKANSFKLLRSEFVGPGQGFIVDMTIDPSETTTAVLRISPGTDNNVSGDFLTWDQ